MTKTLKYLNGYLNISNAKSSIKVGSSWKTYEGGKIFIPDKILTIVGISENMVYYDYYPAIFKYNYSKHISTFSKEVEKGFITLIND